MQYKQGQVYVMSDKYRTTFYIGLTNDLNGRVWQHINDEGSSFVKKHHLFDLVFYECFENITDAINFEKELKTRHHDSMVNLIQSVNPEMKDLKYELEL